MGIEAWSTTPASNNSPPPAGAPEGMAPSTVNNVIRQQMADHRAQWNDAQWFEYGDGDGAATFSYVAATQFKVEGVDVSAVYHVGRRVKIVASTPGTIYGTISAVSFSTDTTVTVGFDSGSLSNEALSVSLGIMTATSDSIPRGVVFADADGDTQVQVEESSDDDIIRFDVAGSEVAQFAGTNLFIGDTANANATQGLTINQGAADDEILALKSSDVGHGYTTGTETDTFALLKKQHPTLGGLTIEVLAEGTRTSNAFNLNVWGDGSLVTTRSTSAHAGIVFTYLGHDGANSKEDIQANGNIACFKKGDIAGTTTLFLIDEDGDFQYDGADGGAFDAIDDLLPIRAAQIAMSGDPKDILRAEFDHAISDNLALAEEWGLIGKTTPEERANGIRGLVNGAQMQRFFMGAHVQSYRRNIILMDVLEEEMPGITAKMQAKLTDAQMPKLPV